MSTRSHAMYFVHPVLLTTVIVVCCGCDNREPTDRFNRNLGEANELLLPGGALLLDARDPGIRAGQTRATIVKRDEPLPPETVTPTTGPAEPAGSVSEALSNIGQAMLGALAGQAPPTSAGTPATAPAGAAPPTPAQPTDTGAIADLMVRYNEARQERKFGELAAFAATAQATVAGEFYDQIEEVTVSVTALGSALSDEQRGRWDAALAAFFSPITLGDITAASAETATASATLARPSGEPKALTIAFQREADQWKIIDPFVPAVDAWEAAKADVQRVIGDLESLSDAAAQNQKPEAMRIDDVLARAIQLLGGQ